MAFVSSIVKTFRTVEGTEVADIMSSTVDLLTLSDANMQTLFGTSSSISIDVIVTMNTLHITFTRNFTIKIFDCAVASQANLSYLINRMTETTFNFS